jgi:hypothetical protein
MGEFALIEGLVRTIELDVSPEMVREGRSLRSGMEALLVDIRELASWCRICSSGQRRRDSLRVLETTFQPIRNVTLDR